ncbi:hypothetical protein [Eikenella corrodens]|uniref:hypothetical protein n=1 Tax=Eikenella corrodens TaxID=539 RepID=UPI00129BA4F3|nr:hypothetical protein [Eikenella corrodens]
MMHIIQRNDHKRGIATVCGEMRYIQTQRTPKALHLWSLGRHNVRRSVTVFMERQFPIDDTAAIEAHKQKLRQLDEQIRTNPHQNYPAAIKRTGNKRKD